MLNGAEVFVYLIRSTLSTARYTQTHTVGLPFEANQVAHSTNRKIQNDVHVPLVNLVYGILPGLDGAEVGVNDREIERRVTWRGSG